ncbi:MAG: glycogen/starch/alpha-glucan phosphorylase [Deltaproteobacteria bacterium]|jgi:starch phosphorylase|nr:glycogen/starch/alpha-glucan phosphorylase [Deltaproteobacteria bacterium]
MTPPQPSELASVIRRKLRYTLGKRWRDASARDFFQATSLAIRELMIDRMFATEERYAAARPRARQLYYLSVEYMVGRSLVNNLLNLDLFDLVERALADLGVDLDDLARVEPDAALGNGGLGRLAACMLDSLATLDLPGLGYGINYEHGLFRQRFENGEQREEPDSWRALGTPWLIERRDQAVLIPVFGRAPRRRARGKAAWTGWRALIGVPHDMPIVGHGAHTVNVLRLYSAHPLDEIDFEQFSRGDYAAAFRNKIDYERISKLLYPSDSHESGRELRLLQEYFFVACALRDICARHRAAGEPPETLPEHVAIHLNDTHPALAVIELLRLLVDEQGIPFGAAWALVEKTFAYTNHTLLPEALECWPLPMLNRVLPRHLQLIELVNAQLLKQVEVRWPGDLDRKRRISIIEESDPKQARMANLAVAGSYAVNGVSELHTRLLKTRLMPDFCEFWPEKFHSKTNGITPRRWLRHANPALATLVSECIGDGWMRDLDVLKTLEPHIEDAAFRERFLAIKHANKERLARVVKATAGVDVDPASLFDVQVKRIHEYKRQLLAALHVIHLYLSAVEDGRELEVPRVCLFAGKAAPSYLMAKLVIRLVNEVARVVNGDPRVKGRLRVAFLPDYSVSLAERIIPAADLSEQISTAGREASGTGNMKLALNGAVTIGTLDGANIEIRDAVGEENIYIFGLRTEEIEDLERRGAYDPRKIYESSPELRRALDALRDGRFSSDGPDLFQPIFAALVEHGDAFYHLADFDAYASTQRRVERDFADQHGWARRAALNVARIGHFSIDRTVREYAEQTWRLQPVR